MPLSPLLQQNPSNPEQMFNGPGKVGADSIAQARCGHRWEGLGLPRPPWDVSWGSPGQIPGQHLHSHLAYSDFLQIKEEREMKTNHINCYSDICEREEVL